MNEWIKVIDRLPSLYQWVLVTNSPKGTDEPRCINIWRWDGVDWDSTGNPGHVYSPTFTDILHEMYTDEVTYWLPLPNEPKNE